MSVEVRLGIFIQQDQVQVFVEQDGRDRTVIIAVSAAWAFGGPEEARDERMARLEAFGIAMLNDIASDQDKAVEGGVPIRDGTVGGRA